MKGENITYQGTVVALKANYLLVDIQLDQTLENQSFVVNESIYLRLLCTCRRRLNYVGFTVSPGDHVLVESIDWNQSRAVISYIEERNSYMQRPDIANFSDIFVVISLDQPQIDLNQVNRFLMIAENTRKNITLVLNKSDLVDVQRAYYFLETFESWGYKPLLTSLKSGIGIDCLLQKLKSAKLSVFSGPSGVGKSSLLNYLIPEKTISVGDISKKLGRGKNTTRHVELFYLENGSLVADTPGFNRPELNVKPVDLVNLFPELNSILIKESCKFRNCLHLNEPGCVIDKNCQRYSYYKEYLLALISSRQKFQGD